KSRNKVSVGEPAEGSLETGPRRRRTRAGLARASSDHVAASARPTHVDDRPRAATPDRASTERWLPSKDQSRPRRRTVSSQNENKKKHPTPNGGSLGSWIDEDRSYLRVVV
ncbi:Uncharacterized protein FWK35_00029303, partial [Aphis craccivora]